MTRSLLLAAAIALGVPAVADAKILIGPTPPYPGGEWVWVEPVYRIEYERVWVPDRVERIPERYWVSATYGWRTIIAYDECGNRVERREWGEISPGYYATRYREVVVSGHYETRQRRVLVSNGYWKYIGPIRPPIIIDPPVVIRPDPPSVPVEGYAKDWEKDKHKFSPLYEWPK